MTIAASRRFAKVPQLPGSLTTRDGIPVTMTGEIWRTKNNRDKRGDVTIAIGRLRTPVNFDMPYSKTGRPRRRSVLHEDFTHLIILYFCEYLKLHSPQSASDCISCFLSLERYLYENHRWGKKRNFLFQVRDLGAPIVDAFGRYLTFNKPGNVRYSSYIKGFYRWGYAARYEGFDDKELRRIERVKFIATLEKDRIAKSHDRNKGALLWEELQQVYIGLDRDKGSDRDRAVVRTFTETSLRPEIAGRLRRSNLKTTPDPELWELVAYRGKARGATSETHLCYVSARLANLLIDLGHDATGPDPFLFHWISSERTTDFLRIAVATWASDVKLKKSPSRGKKAVPLPLTPYRLRRTRATNMAEWGADEDEIASELGQTSTQSARAYTATTSNIVEALRNTLDRHPLWVNLLDTFAGRIADPQDDGLPKIFGGVPTFARYQDFVNKIGVIGNCASPDPCNLYPPLSCYPCEYMRASQRVESHEQQLEQLKAEIDENIGIESDRMGAVMLPHLAAVLKVIGHLRQQQGLQPHPLRTTTASEAIFDRSTRSVKKLEDQ